MFSTLKYPSRYLKFDITAGIVVFLVAIPLCLGIALASGAPLLSGLVSGIIGGVVVGLISESAVSVSGPAAGMVAVVLAAIAQLGDFNSFLLALFIAGILQILIGYLRAGFAADYIPSNVIQGLLCAIGILIIIKQLPFAIIYTSQASVLMSMFREASQTLSLAPLQDIATHVNLGAVIISVLSLTLLIFFDKTKNPRLKSVPGPIVVVIVATLINEIFIHVFPELAQYDAELVNIPCNGTFCSFLTQLQTPAWQAWTNPNVYLYAFILAAVASLEALLNLEAIEKLDKLRRYCSRNRELVAQGIGNMLSGLFGGLPITSVVVRGSVNIQAGAQTKLSTIFHGFLILFVIVLIPHWINLIPLAALATILMFVGFKLTKPIIYKNMYDQGISRFLPFIITVIAIISTNLLTGILIGLFLGFFFILRDNSQIQLDIINEQHSFGVVNRIILPQHMSFLRKAALIAELDSIEEGSNLIIDARYTKYIDRDILEVLDVFKKNQAPDKRIAVNTIGFKDKYEIHDQIEFLNVITYDTQSTLTPIDVLEILKEGNKRFIEDKPIHRSLLNDIKETSTTQHPIAIVLGCIDSRVPIETIFDMGVGDVFVVRIAGNVINDDILASMEFACEISKAKLILVLGHTYCGAIKAACENYEAGGYLSSLLEKIKPAIAKVSHKVGGYKNCDSHFINDVTQQNIHNTMENIYHKSSILHRLIKDKTIGLVGAIYNVETGVVRFYKPESPFFNE